MAKKQIHISIEKPCSENWNLMASNDKGKFCMSCQKTVVDFSIMTDTQVLQYFDSYKGATCGRFTEKQLQTPMSANIVGKPQRHWAWALSALLLPTVAASQTVKTTESVAFSVDKNAVYPSVKTDKKSTENDSAKLTSITLHGIVSDSAGQIPGASIVLKGTTVGTATDGDGQFQLTLSSQYTGNQRFEIVISAVGYETQTLILDKSFEDKHLYFCLKEDTTLMGEVVVIGGVSYSHANIFKRTKYFFKRLFNR